MQIKLSSLAAATLIATFALTACNKPENDGKTLAKVNGTSITRQDLELTAQQSGHGEPRQMKDLDYVISEELMYQQGCRIGLDKDPTYKKQLAALELKGHGMAKDQPNFGRYVASQMRSEMARRVFNTQIASKVEVTMPEAHEYFDKNREIIRSELHLGLLKFQEQGDALKALHKIRQGTSFEAIAREREQKKAQQPADLGFVPWKEIPVDFVEPLYRLKPGEVSGIMGNQEAGFQIIKMYGSRPSQANIEFKDVSGIIMNGLRDLKLVQEHHKYLEQLKKQAKIVTF
jgi:peptidyl-prolyl cis-trans isomerase C